MTIALTSDEVFALLGGLASLFGFIHWIRLLAGKTEERLWIPATVLLFCALDAGANGGFWNWAGVFLWAWLTIDAAQTLGEKNGATR